LSRSTTSLIRSRFAQIVARADEEISLAEAALVIAAEEYPRLDIELYQEKLDRFADLARDRALKSGDAFDPVSALNATLFDELGFHGNSENYYDPRNSFLNEVIDRRMGIPITLTVIYIEVARRIGVAIEGIGMPGHFIARYSSGDGEVFIDAFNRGRLLGRAGCAEFFSEMTGGRFQLEPEHLAPVPKKQILSRMLSNLLGIYAASDNHRALAVIERILLISPDSPPHVRDRGLLLAVIGDATTAIEELERYLALAPDAGDAESIREQIKSIRQTRARLN
jgi:regulator of sirC expression with transglutaminase-like and TPR domain